MNVFEERANAHHNHLVTFTKANGKHNPETGGRTIFLAKDEMLKCKIK